MWSPKYTYKSNTLNNCLGFTNEAASKICLLLKFEHKRRVIQQTLHYKYTILVLFHYDFALTIRRLIMVIV